MSNIVTEIETLIEKYDNAMRQKEAKVYEFHEHTGCSHLEFNKALDTPNYPNFSVSTLSELGRVIDTVRDYTYTIVSLNEQINKLSSELDNVKLRLDNIIYELPYTHDGITVMHTTESGLTYKYGYMWLIPEYGGHPPFRSMIFTMC